MRHHYGSLVLVIEDLLPIASTVKDDSMSKCAVVSLQDRQEDTEGLRQRQAGQAHVRLPINVQHTLQALKRVHLC